MRFHEIITEDQQHIMYHVTKSESVNQIMRYGLKAREYEEGIYLWDSLYSAEFFKEIHEDDGEDMTILKVDVSRLSLEDDSETYDMREWSSRFNENEPGYGYIYKDDYISPERISVLY